MAPRAAATRAPLRQDCLEELQILAKVRFREKQARVTFDRERVSVEQMPLPIARCMVESPGEVEEAGQHILSHGAGIPIAARGGDDDFAAPEIPA